MCPAGQTSESTPLPAFSLTLPLIPLPSSYVAQQLEGDLCLLRMHLEPGAAGVAGEPHGATARRTDGRGYGHGGKLPGHGKRGCC